MATALVVLVSLLVGAATYVATVRGGRRTPAAIGFDGSGAALAVGSAPVPEPPDAHPETADEDGSDEAIEADVVDLDAARDRGTAGAPPETASDADLETASAIEAGDANDATTAAVELEREAATGPLAPVIVTAATVPAPEPGYAYLRVANEGPTWRDRIAGILGIAILVVLGAGGVAFAIYQLGSAVNALVQRFLNG